MSPCYPDINSIEHLSSKIGSRLNNCKVNNETLKRKITWVTVGENDIQKLGHSIED